jgi:hypothetical protein
MKMNQIKRSGSENKRLNGKMSDQFTTTVHRTNEAGDGKDELEEESDDDSLPFLITGKNQCESSGDESEDDSIPDLCLRSSD